MADAIFGFGCTGTGSVTPVSITNLVDNVGGVATDQTALTGTARYSLAAAGYGGDKAIFGYGNYGAISGGGTVLSTVNLVSNAGVVAADTTGVGTARYSLAAAEYGTDKAIFGFGCVGTATPLSITNLVSNAGVVATDTTGVGTPRFALAAAGYGGDKAIFGFGADENAGYTETNLVSNAGVVSTDTYNVATPRFSLAAAGYGGDKAIFGFGYDVDNYYNITNLVSNAGVVATDTTVLGTARNGLAAAGYGGNKAIFGFGTTVSATAVTNLVSNTGVVATDTTGVGTARFELAAAGLSSGSSGTTTTTTASPPGPPGTTTTTTSAPTNKQYTLTNIGTEDLTLQSMIFYDPLNIGHVANLINLGGSSAETSNASLSYNFPAGTSQTFTLDYFNISAAGGTYYGNVIINGSDNTRQVIGSVITVPVRTEPCNTVVSYDGGLTFPSEFLVNFGANTAGTVTFTYNAFSIPDRFVVIHNGAVQIDTGYCGNPGYLGELNSALPSYPPSYTTSGVTIYNTYPVSSINPNNLGPGLSFTKVAGVPTATVLIFGPLSGTYWQCQVTCASPIIISSTTTTTAAPGNTTTTTTRAPTTSTTTTRAPSTTTTTTTTTTAAPTSTTTTTTAAPPSGTVEFVGTLNPSPGVGAYGLVNQESNNIGPGEVTLTFTSAGTVTVFSACLNGVSGTIVDDEMYNTWFTPSGGSPGLSYDIRISSVSGAVPARTSFADFTRVKVTNQSDPPPFSTDWFPLSSNQSVSVYLNANSLNTSYIALTITFEIALAGTGVSIYSGTGQLRMGDEPP